jgi:hypothetical protein
MPDVVEDGIVTHIGFIMHKPTTLFCISERDESAK